MTYSEYAPQLPTSFHIKCLWTLEEDALTYNRDSIAPDSYVEVIVSVGAPLFALTESGTYAELPRVFVKGLQKGPLHIHATDLTQLIGVRMYPWMLPTLLGQTAPHREMPLMMLTGRWLLLPDLLRAALNRGGEDEAIETLRHFITDQPAAHPLMTTLHTAGSLMIAAQGQIRMSEIAAQCALSLSQFERQFKQFAGITPKGFARLVRFEAIRDSLAYAPATSLADLAYLYGYTDQAHFIHDFKTFAGHTPGQFAARSLQNADFLQSS